MFHGHFFYVNMRLTPPKICSFYLYAGKNRFQNHHKKPKQPWNNYSKPLYNYTFFSPNKTSISITITGIVSR